VVALAYCINYVTQSLGAADYLVAVTTRLFTPELLVAATFLLTALISFSTGTSWGAFALIMPIALPMAYAFTGGQIDPLVFKTVAAVTGGGIFGDHASPVSDTSVLSSAGAGSDHMDHVITQLPYALVVAVCTIILYLLV
jgi:Na+/H+ antiporter NhaC